MKMGRTLFLPMPLMSPLATRVMILSQNECLLAAHPGIVAKLSAALGGAGERAAAWLKVLHGRMGLVRLWRSRERLWS